MSFHAALDPAGPQAERIASLWWLMFWSSLVVFLLVAGVLTWAVVRSRVDARRLMPAPLVHPGPERIAGLSVGLALAATVVVLLVFLVASVSTGHGLASLPVDGALSLKVIGHQWWWEVEYPDAEPVKRVLTANEIHIPVGRVIRIRTESRDVIHSLWVPPLHGKRDLIPGRPTDVLLRADRAGLFRGMCAEFCGLQHAHMQLVVIAEPPEQFEAWATAQRLPAPAPRGELEQRGQDVFVHGPCALCHAIRGTDAGGHAGPDLTHLASRATLASGMMPNTVGHLAGWILDAQHVKPGNGMPAIALAPDELHALLAYLATLR